MTTKTMHLDQLLEIIADALTHDNELDPGVYNVFFHSPELCMPILDYLDALNEDALENDNSLLSAAVYALEMSISQLQSDVENGNRGALKVIQQCMQSLAHVINQGKHSLPFWLPILNAFYDAGIELTPELKAAYMDLANEGYQEEAESDIDHVEAIRSMIAQSQELSVFEIAENFFAQTYALPPEFFVDLVMDLMTLKEGQDIGLLFLFHPNPDVRHYVIEALGDIITEVRLSSMSLSRLQLLSTWYPDELKPTIKAWIKAQRKFGVVFAKPQAADIIKLKATEIDGVASQGVFIHVREGRKHRLCGLLLKVDAGIKDVWVTQHLPAGEVKSYYEGSLQDSVTLRKVSPDYLSTLINHFLATTLGKGAMPNLSLLQLIELLNLPIQPAKIDLAHHIDSLSMGISPFTQEAMHASFKRSRRWLSSKSFTESWYAESAELDRIVNKHCSFVEGTKVCDFESAIEEAMVELFEHQRDKWLFHFVWTTLWLHSGTSKNEKVWQDCLFIAYAIHLGTTLQSIPLISAICKQSVINSVETMQDRKTHLS